MKTKGTWSLQNYEESMKSCGDFSDFSTLHVGAQDTAIILHTRCYSNNNL